MGHQPADSNKGWVPAYHFWMRNLSSTSGHCAGGIGLRIGNSDDILLYYGHIGYHVFPHHRGHHFAERACRLLLPIARHHGLHTLWITCNPDNHASRRTCERLGMQLIDTVNVPPRNPLYLRGERQKCRYRLELA
jgi:tagatose 1,6-diphosphate aldolase